MRKTHKYAPQKIRFATRESGTKEVTRNILGLSAKRSGGHDGKFAEIHIDEKRTERPLGPGTRQTGKVVRSWDTKAKATKGGVLERAVGGEGSVKIQKENGRFQEERTFPRSEDPRKSKG